MPLHGFFESFYYRTKASEIKYYHQRCLKYKITRLSGEGKHISLSYKEQAGDVNR